MNKVVSRTNQFAAIDITKFIMSIVVIILHCFHFSGFTLGAVFHATFVRLAVPFFFCATGFFWQRKLIFKTMAYM